MGSTSGEGGHDPSLALGIGYDDLQPATPTRTSEEVPDLVALTTGFPLRRCGHGTKDVGQVGAELRMRIEDVPLALLRELHPPSLRIDGEGNYRHYK
jgi:hypothetical protein